MSRVMLLTCLSLFANAACTPSPVTGQSSRVLEENVAPCDEASGNEYPDTRSYMGFSAEKSISLKNTICYSFVTSTERTTSIVISGLSQLNNGSSTDLLKEGYQVEKGEGKTTFRKAGAPTLVLSEAERYEWNGKFFFEARFEVEGSGSVYEMRKGTTEEILERKFCAEGYVPTGGGTSTMVSPDGHSLNVTVESCASLMSMGGRHIIPVNIRLHDSFRGIDASISYPDERIQYHSTHHNDNDSLLFRMTASGVDYHLDGRVLTARRAGEADESYYAPAAEIPENRELPRLGFLDFLNLSSSTTTTYGEVRTVLFQKSLGTWNGLSNLFLDPRARSLPTPPSCANWDRRTLTGQVMLASQATRLGGDDSGLFLIRLDNATCFSDIYSLMSAFSDIAYGASFDDGLFTQYGSRQGWPGMPLLLVDSQSDLDQLLKLGADSGSSALKDQIVLSSTIVKRN